MATNDGIWPNLGRQLAEQSPVYLRKSVAYNTANIASADSVLVGYLPAGAQILDIIVNVTAAFNAGTTNVLTVGTSAGSDADIVAAADVNEAAVAATRVTTGLTLAVAAPVAVYAKYTQTGTAATAGAATIVITYACNNDG